MTEREETEQGWQQVTGDTSAAGTGAEDQGTDAAEDARGTTPEPTDDAGERERSGRE